MTGMPVLSKNYPCSPPYFCIKNIGSFRRDERGGDENSETEQDSDINNFTLEYVNEFISVLFPFVYPIQFKLVLKYCAACLLYARGFFNTKLPIQRYIFPKTLSYYALMQCSIDISD